MDQIREIGAGAIAKKFPKFKGPVYITYDVDCLDPAYAPGTGTPVPGGLTTYETQQIFRSLKVDQLIGGDVVELSPPYDPSEITALAALDAVFEMLCLF
jgi:agmatinase/guanidinopropionase